MSRKCILIVEDDEDIRSSFALALEEEGYTALLAHHGRSALALLAGLNDSDLPSCIILEIMMPEMNGLEFLAAIKSGAYPRCAEIPVIIATAQGSPVDPEMIPLSVERIQKPMDLDELYRVVRKHCESTAERMR